MGYYDHSKDERKRISDEIVRLTEADYGSGCLEHVIHYSSDPDTYIRKIVYLATGRLYCGREALREPILNALGLLLANPDEKVRQTTVYALGEIGKADAPKVTGMLERAMGDGHHSVVNAVVGALKQMGEKNPGPTLEFARRFLKHPDPKVRREVIHGVELRGRTHPEEVLPILCEVRHDPDRKIRNMVVHVLGQISYKKGCLEKVTAALKQWDDRDLVSRALEEILKVHVAYARFSARTHEEAKEYISKHFG